MTTQPAPSAEDTTAAGSSVSSASSTSSTGSAPFPPAVSPAISPGSSWAPWTCKVMCSALRGDGRGVHATRPAPGPPQPIRRASCTSTVERPDRRGPATSAADPGGSHHPCSDRSGPPSPTKVHPAIPPSRPEPATVRGPSPPQAPAIPATVRPPTAGPTAARLAQALPTRALPAAVLPSAARPWSQAAACTVSGRCPAENGVQAHAAPVPGRRPANSSSPASTTAGSTICSSRPLPVSRPRPGGPATGATPSWRASSGSAVRNTIR